MTLFLPENDRTLYEALVARSHAYEGLAYVGVRTTGIFCRFTCPARKPKRENCVFFECIAACMEAGFRPCKRCQPLRAVGEREPLVSQLLTALEQEPERRWCEGDVSAMGLDPSTVRRAFKRHLGVTFLELARTTRLRLAADVLEQGGRVIDAQMTAGFSSASAFAEAMSQLLGIAPSKLSGDALLKMDWIDTPLGPMVAVCDETRLHLLEFVDRKALSKELKRLFDGKVGRLGLGQTSIHRQLKSELDAYYAGVLTAFQTPLALHGSAFQKSVWRVLQSIPIGERRSYSDIAREIGSPRAVRAVAQANGANQIAILIACHRVVGADGSLTGYGGGLWRKQKLLELETQAASTRLISLVSAHRSS
ncbi:bifunctional transcriptional activator/DNA repair enzyme AdaA [Polycladidibacter stylochi]|uniref:bifunctional transcriptional activator/DNA repair enzyme AdaA n=1 Tax=Polycladidibacter stylochi TaxID=1807766 RepID=UPI00083674C5|nr:trifunctional transcriptional activator/DNA repair protein Ada/methylated-DNA--[protein]-cysteine S-methyltransferase [Pseudovibrio stylochi]